MDDRNRGPVPVAIQPTALSDNFSAAPHGCRLVVSPDGWKLEVCTRSVGGSILWSLISLGFTALAYWLWFSDAKWHIPEARFVVPPLFTLVALSCWSRVVMHIGGRVMISTNDDEGVLFTGVGSVGRTQHFKWSEMRDILTEYHKNDSGDPSLPYLVLLGRKRMYLTDAIDTDIHEFIVGVIRSQIKARQSPGLQSAESR